MESYEEYLSLAQSVPQSDKDDQNQPYNKVIKKQYFAKRRAKHFILLHKIHRISVAPLYRWETEAGKNPEICSR